MGTKRWEIRIAKDGSFVLKERSSVERGANRQMSPEEKQSVRFSGENSRKTRIRNMAKGAGSLVDIHPYLRRPVRGVARGYCTAHQALCKTWDRVGRDIRAATRKSS